MAAQAEQDRLYLKGQGLAFNRRSQEDSDIPVHSPPKAGAGTVAWARPVGCGSAENIKVWGEFGCDTGT